MLVSCGERTRPQAVLAGGGGSNTFYLSYFINSLEIRMNSITLSRNVLRKAI